MEYQQMREMEKTHCCARCRGALVTVWDGEAGIYRLVCGLNHSHHGYQKILSPAEALSRGKLSEYLGDNSQEDLEKLAARGAPAVSRLLDKDLHTGELIPRDKLLALVHWGAELGLKAYLGHVCLYFDKPYVTIDGYYYKNNKRDKPYLVGTRPARDDERQQYQVAEGDYFYIAEAWLPEAKLPTVGIGIVTKEEIEGKSERRSEQFRAPIVHGHPQRMAEKRAEWQLLRKLIPLEEQGD